MKEETAKCSMQIILHAGDARDHIRKSLDYVAEFKFVEAEEEINKAKEEIVKAHRLQTDAIQQEMQNEKVEYSVLFAHAQDTLMTIYSELNISKHIIATSKQLDQRINNLERRKEDNQ